MAEDRTRPSPAAKWAPVLAAVAAAMAQSRADEKRGGGGGP